VASGFRRKPLHNSLGVIGGVPLFSADDPQALRRRQRRPELRDHDCLTRDGDGRPARLVAVVPEQEVGCGP